MNYEIDELDRSLVTALQIHPRASWTQLAPILRTSSSTISRRWDRLHEAGLVWSFASMAPPDLRSSTQIGIIAVRCATSKRESVIERLVSMPEVFSLVTCAGPQDLVCMVTGANLHSIDSLVYKRIITVDGVIRTVTNFPTGISVEGSDFRLDGLSEDQARAVAALRPIRKRQDSEPTQAQLGIARYLSYDARRPAAEIARLTGHSHAHIQRQIAYLQSTSWFRPRTDFSMTDFGLVAVYFWIQCTADQQHALARFVRRSPAVRLAMPIVARANMLLSVWVAGLEQIPDFERERHG
jgi:DNA-binding Lrp family transcriptional regulator